MDIRSKSGLSGLTVCMVSPYLPRVGGIAVQTASMVAGLESENVKVLRVDTIMHRLDNRRYLQGLRVLLQPLTTAVQFVLNAPKADVVHVHACSRYGFMPVVVCAPLNRLLFRKRLVISFHGAEGHVWIRRAGWLVRLYLKMADEVVVVSPQLKDAFAKHGITSWVLWNLVDLERFTFRERKNIRPNIVWIRHFEEMYDPMTAVKVFHRIKRKMNDATITFIGDGSIRPQMEEYIAEHQLTGVEFLGRLANSSVPPVFDKADIFLNTSKNDGLPTALLEASAAGLPVVTTNAGGIPNMMENGKDGVVVPVGDVDALAQAIIELLEHPERAAAMSVAARKNAERYGWKERVKDMARLYGIVGQSNDP